MKRLDYRVLTHPAFLQRSNLCTAELLGQGQQLRLRGESTAGYPLQLYRVLNPIAPERASRPLDEPQRLQGEPFNQGRVRTLQF
jgi:hypothetical protein